jgi:hypothetical protein
MTNPPQRSDEPSRPRPGLGAPQPYGPGHGPGTAAPPARKSHLRRYAGLVALALLFVAAVLLNDALGGTVLDRAAVERDVAQQFQQREGVAVDLSCAEEMKVREGATYDCTGTTAAGEDVSLRIAITDEDSAAYTWTEP